MNGLRIYLLLKEDCPSLHSHHVVANVIIAQLLFLEREDPDRDINLYITSPGGVVSAGLAIYDTMQLINPDVSTICLGMAASMATILLSGGAKGKRYALPNSTIHMHQPLGGAQGQASDIESLRVNHTLRLFRSMLAKLRAALMTKSPPHRPDTTDCGAGNGVRFDR